MTAIYCFTSATFTYLDRARVLAETIRKHHPDWRLHLLLCDEEPPGFFWNPSNEIFDSIVRTNELEIPDYRRWAFGHNIVEFCTAVKGFMLDKLLTSGADAVVYLDPDIAVFSPLDDVVRLLQHNSVILTPHVTTAETTLDAISDNEIGSLQHGIYNLGFVAVRGCTEGRRFARWWRDRLNRFCWDDIPGGLFVDQRWCDLAPALFDGVAVLRDHGYNVASWNLGNRPIGIGADGTIRAGGVPLRFFHFTKVNGLGELMLQRYAYGRTEVFELMRYYRERLMAHRPANLPDSWWALSCYSDGAIIPQVDRVTWRTRQDLREHFSNPFQVGTDSFQSWCVQQRNAH
ncbi:MAG: glycosyltransferase family 32 protein [Acidiphilium sp.]